ncbi:chemotaxis protein [Shewanella sp. NFH-SH190041]|uniref:methyl-accepting chemotaxis protein n=1 Tax=Shewanella sp. NFH-SH190041 TaxID=2950245 RepID=UPI0021C2A76B|nr:PAS domain-containing methyl-accepting chemotaxis protein [Shewanella sp. NFH-SH190041]BDM65212.1 chemotaxis protein [Shewanella sp. NFH-SH190041]
MRDQAPVTQREKPIAEDAILLSTTDLKGRIKYANQAFCEQSEYTMDEMHGRPHNMIRHPDMPKAAFKTLWQRVQSGKPWMGMVKNRCRSGDHYWVNAYVAPVYENGQVHEYQSVRRQATRAQINAAEALYQTLNAGKTPRIIKQDKLGLTGRILFLLALVSAISVAAAQGHWLLGLVAGLVVGLGGGLALLAPFNRLVRRAEKIIDDPVAKAIYTGRRDDIGQLDLALQFLVSETAGVVGRMADSAASISEQSADMSDMMQQSCARAQSQSEHTTASATAIEEMNCSFAEVGNNIQQAASAVHDSLRSADQGHDKLELLVNAIETVSTQVSGFAGIVHSIEQDSQAINDVLEVIRAIADQTNLLALNAAIEAARAGESGRGFAVVADEVRHLSARTAESTGQIETIVQKFRASTDSAAQAMEAGNEQVDKAVALAREADTAFQDLQLAMESLNSLSDANAAAMSQQTTVAGEISQSIHDISGLAQDSFEQTRQAEEMGSQMHRLSIKTYGLSAQFWKQSVQRRLD